MVHGNFGLVQLNDGSSMMISVGMITIASVEEIHPLRVITMRSR